MDKTKKKKKNKKKFLVIKKSKNLIITRNFHDNFKLGRSYKRGKRLNLHEIKDIKTLFEAGHKISKISRKLKIDYKCTKKWALNNGEIRKLGRILRENKKKHIYRSIYYKFIRNKK